MSKNNIDYEKVWKNAFGNAKEEYDAFGFLMIFENYGKEGVKGAWNVDHIYPINPMINNSSHKCNYSGSSEQENLQPMSLVANQLKGNALNGPFERNNKRIRWKVAKSPFKFGANKKRIGWLGICFDKDLCLYIYNNYAYQYNKKSKKIFGLKFNKDFYDKPNFKEFFNSHKKELRRSPNKNRFFDPINQTDKNKKEN